MCHKILVVDDQAPVIEVISLFLNGRGYKVHAYRDARQVLARLEREPFPLVLTDVDMPVMDGRELLAGIRKRHRGTKVVVMSGAYTEDDSAGFILMGALDFYAKPLDMYQCCDRLRAAFDDRRGMGRRPIVLPATIDLTLRGETVNVSADGVLFKSRRPCSRSTDVSVELGPDGDRIGVTGRVVRSYAEDGGFFTAIHFAESIGDRLPRLVRRMAAAD
jgi:CheY-like chemotaxis protein